jgi:hypothetical protein
MTTLDELQKRCARTTLTKLRPNATHQERVAMAALWLKGLFPLASTNVLPGGAKTRRGNQTPTGQNKLGPSPDRWKIRSKTYQGIADAMAQQWGKHD